MKFISPQILAILQQRVMRMNLRTLLKQVLVLVGFISLYSVLFHVLVAMLLGLCLGLTLPGVGYAQGKKKQSVASLIKNLSFRLSAEEAVEQRSRFIMAITDSNENFVIEQRNGVAEVRSGTGDEPVDLSMDSQAFRLFYIGKLSLDTGFAEGQMTGDKAKARAFFDLFDWPGQGES